MRHFSMLLMACGVVGWLAGCGDTTRTGVGGVDGGSLGSLGRGYLRSSPYARLFVEVDHAQGLAPSSSALAHLRNILQTYADKPQGLAFGGETEFEPPKATYTVRDILSLAQSVRNVRTGGDTAAMQFLYLNGRFQDGNALGVAVNASTVAVFPERIDDAAAALVLAPQIEEAVLVHEAGHLFGLVNLTYRSAIDHEDSQHTHHCTDQNCVMYWAIEDVSLANLLNFGPPSDFTASCCRDLQDLQQP